MSSKSNGSDVACGDWGIGPRQGSTLGDGTGTWNLITVCSKTTLMAGGNPRNRSTLKQGSTSSVKGVGGVGTGPNSRTEHPRNRNLRWNLKSETLEPPLPPASFGPAIGPPCPPHAHATEPGDRPGHPIELRTVVEKLCRVNCKAVSISATAICLRVWGNGNGKNLIPVPET